MLCRISLSVNNQTPQTVEGDAEVELPIGGLVDRGRCTGLLKVWIFIAGQMNRERMGTAYNQRIAAEQIKSR